MTLTDNLDTSTDEVSLDTQGFTQGVMTRLGVPEEFAQDLGPLVLWWTSAGDKNIPDSARADGWIDLGSARVRLRPWTFKERSQTLEGCVVAESENAVTFNILDYLVSLLESSVAETDPKDLDIWMLDSAAATALVSAAVGVNMPIYSWMKNSDQGSLLDTRQIAMTTLRLCRALGWTPSQVWATPAPDVDELLEMLHFVESEAPVSPGPVGMTGIFAHPDTVIIQIEDD